MPPRPRSRRPDPAPDPTPAAAAAQAAAGEEPADVEAERRAVARVAARVPDDELAGLEDLELIDEARRRGVTFTRSVTRGEIIAAAVAATATQGAP